MATLAELLRELDGEASAVEKTAGQKDSVQNEESDSVDSLLEQVGLATKEEKAVEKTANDLKGEGKMSTLYDALRAEWSEQEVEKTASEEHLENDPIQERTDVIGELAGEIFAEIVGEELEKIASALAPDDSMKYRGKATGMFGEVGDARMMTNRPADSNKAVDTTPMHHDLDEESKALVGLCIKKKILTKAMGG